MRVSPRRLLAVALITALPLPALAQPGDKAGAPTTNRTVTATGVTKPPAASTSTSGSNLSPAVRTEMARAEKAAAERNRAWDSKMRTTMGSICRGC